jgi:hypothetical protein
MIEAIRLCIVSHTTPEIRLACLLLGIGCVFYGLVKRPKD